jgi:hypothetical protein
MRIHANSKKPDNVQKFIKPQRASPRNRLGAVFSAIMVSGTAAPALAYDPGYPFNQYKATGSQQKDCNEYVETGVQDVGEYKYSCRHTQLSHIQGEQNIQKFEGLACAHGRTDAFAKQIAGERATEIVHNLQNQELQKLKDGGDQSIHYYVPDKSDYHCVNTGKGSKPAEVAEKPKEAKKPKAAPVTKPPVYVSPEPDNTPEPHNPWSASFTLHSRDRYKLGVEFYSQSGGAWPGGNQQYNLSETQTFTLKCDSGEKICFGAWRDHQTIYWGVGKNGGEGCTSCCITCGHDYETTLNDGGPDSYSSNNSGGSTFIPTFPTFQRNAPRAAPPRGNAPVYRPAPRGNNSTITGHSR